MAWGMALVAPLALVALTLAFAVHRIDTFDVWYHLAAGRLMVETGTWPRVNTFAFTAPEHPWIDLHWGYQLVLYTAYRIGGAPACTLLAAACTLGTVCMLYRLARRWLRPAAATLLLAAAVTVASPRLMPRPEMFSFLLLATYLTILEGQQRESPAWGRAVWLLVPLQIVWANVQGIFPVGLVVIGGYWAGATLAHLPLPADWGAASRLPPPAWRRLGLVLVLATAGCLLNPYGVEGALFPLELLRNATGGALVSARIGELRGPFEAGPIVVLSYLWVGMVALAVAGVLLRIRHLALGRVLVATAFALLATQALRHLALSAWVLVPTIAATLGPLVSPLPGARRPLRVVRAAVAPVLVLALAAAVATNHFSRLVDSRREFGLGIAEQRFPRAAADFLERAGITGRPFNGLSMGGYLIWRRGGGDPPQAVFVDGRLETYPLPVFRSYFRALDDPRSFAHLATRYRPDFVVLTHASRNRLPLVTYLAAGHGWTMVYYDDTTAIFLPVDEAHRQVRARALRAFDAIREARRRRQAPPPRTTWQRLVDFPIVERWTQHRYGEFLRAMHRWAEAADAYERALAADPALIETRLLLGHVLWRTGARARAKAEWREVRRRAPTFAPAAQALTEAGAARPEAGPATSP